MKAYLLTAALSLATCAAFAQKATPTPAIGQESDAPFKRANTIIIHTPDSAAVAYKKIAAAFLAAGYSIDRADKELAFVNTKARPTAKLNGLHAIQAAVVPTQSGADIQLRGVFSMPGAAAMSPIMAGESETEFRGMKGSMFMVCWDELQRVAQSYPSGRVAYMQRR